MNVTSYIRTGSRISLFIAAASVVIGCWFLNVAQFLPYLAEHNRYLNIVGIGVILAIAYVSSSHRSAVSGKIIISGLLFHFALAVLVLKTALGQYAVSSLSYGVAQLYGVTNVGIGFLFGNLASPEFGWGFIFAIKVLPIIIFFGALMSLLFYAGVIQVLVLAINKIIQPLLGTTGAETLCAIANSFLGQTEAPLLVRNYLPGMTKSEFMVVMISGMGTISGAILAVFAAMGVPAQHLLASSVMAIPATIMIAKIMYPETERSETTGTNVTFESSARNPLDAISQGTSDGLQLALNVGAMLIVFLSLLALINGCLSGACMHLNSMLDYYQVGFELPIIDLQSIFGFVCLPFAWLLGFNGEVAWSVAELLGTKVAINELVAYGKMVAMHLDERTSAITTYALCGFSNFSCIGIQIGGIGALVPEKRVWLSELGVRAVFGAALANLLSAMVAGLLL